MSLETPVGDGDSVYSDLIEDYGSDQPETVTTDRMRDDEMERALAHLNPRMQRVLELRYGLHGESPRSLEEVGKVLGVTRERVRQLEANAFRELQSVAPDLRLYLRAGRSPQGTVTWCLRSSIVHSHVIPSGDDGVSSMAEGPRAVPRGCGARHGRSVRHAARVAGRGLYMAREEAVREAY